MGMPKARTMDTIIPGKNKKIRIAAIAGVAILSLGLMAWMSLSRKSQLDVRRDAILIKTVSIEPFDDFALFNARVEPLRTMLVNILEGGAVQEIFVENGSRVEKGQPLVRLYNPNSELGYMNQETALIEQMNNLNTAKLTLRNQELGLTKDLASIEHDYNDAKRLYDLNATLYEKGVISRNDWNQIQENFRYQSERRSHILESIQREKSGNRIQIAQLDRSLAIMEKSLAIVRANRNHMLVTAPASGILTSFEPVPGQTYASGQALGRIDLGEGYKLSAAVDEFYLDKIRKGQKGTVSVGNKSVGVVVSKRIPEVQGGRFGVELVFAGDLPTLQQGTSLGVKLRLSASRKAVVIPQGSFHADTGGQWVFVVEGDKAERRTIRTGGGNADYIEVLEGLRPGDRVITSSYRDFTRVEQLNIK